MATTTEDDLTGTQEKRLKRAVSMTEAQLKLVTEILAAKGKAADPALVAATLQALASNYHTEVLVSVTR